MTDELIKVRIAETKEIKTIPKPFAIRWKVRLGKMTWDPINYLYEMTEQQYKNEMRAAKYNKLLGVAVFAVIVYLIVNAY